MSKKYTILALLAGIVLLLSFSANPPNGHTGGPGEGLCSDCHIQNNPPQMGNIAVTGLPATIIPNTAYVLTMTSTMTFDPPGGDTEKAGFQLVILDSNNNDAGDISSPSAGSTTQTSSGREYWEHNPAQTYPAPNVVTWTATWTAPNMPPNTTITIYAAGNIANGNGNNSGDLIVTTTASGMLMGGGSNLMVSVTSSTDVLCNGQNTGSATATATGGTPPYTYNWSNGGSGPTINNLPAGTYTVTATDFAAATATDNVVITQPPAIVFNTPVINNVDCFGGNDGSITTGATGGTPPYEFNWSNGASGTTISNLTAGSYTVTVFDDNSCTKTATYMVTQPPNIVINLVDLNHETCAGAEDGSIIISVSGGVPPIFAAWSNGYTGLNNDNLAPDTYSVTVTDNNDCTKTASYTVNPGGTLNVVLVQLVNVSCNGGNNGSISLNTTGGNPPYTYAWSNGMFGASITGLVAATYLVTVTDANACSVVKNYTVTQPPAIIVSIMQSSQNLCFGDATADLIASSTGGVPGYTYLWSNGTAGANNSNLPAGTYTVTVTDANGCTATVSANVTQPTLLTVSVTTTDETSSGGNNGTATANAGGGTPGYTYLWNTGATTPMIIFLPPGTYSVTITDASGCTATGSGQVNEFGCSMDVLLGPDMIICEEDTVTIIPSVMGASGTFTYLWTGGSTGASLQVTSGGEYCVTVMDQANCSDIDCIVITENIIPLLTCPVTNESAPGANDGAINCDGTPGIASYLWSNGATTSTISGLSPGEYCVTVTDINGCTRAQCFNVQPGNCQMTVTSAQTNVSCNGDSTGSISLTVNGATAPVTYTWSNAGTTAVISNLAAGNYSVTVADAAGCVENQSFLITEPAALLITIDTVVNITDTAGGSIHITITGGTQPYNILWLLPDGSTIQDVEDLDGLQLPGLYTVSVTDNFGCSLTLFDINVEMEVAVDRELNFKALKVYPVPTDDVLIVDMENAITEALITGVDGRLCKRITNPVSNRLEVGELESGWYIIRLSDGESWYIARMVK